MFTIIIYNRLLITKLLLLVVVVVHPICLNILVDLISTSPGPCALYAWRKCSHVSYAHNLVFFLGQAWHIIVGYKAQGRE